jgi:membrane protein
VIAPLRSIAAKVQNWLPVRVLSAFGQSQASSYASALAFNAMMAMFPLILGVLAVIGLSIRDPATELKFQNLIVQSFPSAAQPEVLDALKGVKASAGWFGLLSIGGLIWSASGIFATMEFVFAQVFGIKQRDMVRQKLMGFVMMFVLVAAVGLTVAANWATGLLPYSGSWLVSFAIGSIVMVTLLVLLYRFVPNRAFRFRDVLPGALLAGFLIEVVSLAFPLYARISHGFNTYGAQFALFLLLATWFYLLSNLILLGAVYNKFRLGEPGSLGLIASPAHESRAVRRPDEVIKKKKREFTSPPPAEVGPQRRVRGVHSRQSPVRAAAGYVLVGLAILTGLFRRRGSHTIKT